MYLYEPNPNSSGGTNQNDHHILQKEVDILKERNTEGKGSIIVTSDYYNIDAVTCEHLFNFRAIIILSDEKINDGSDNKKDDQDNLKSEYETYFEFSKDEDKFLGTIPQILHNNNEWLAQRALYISTDSKILSPNPDDDINCIKYSKIEIEFRFKDNNEAEKILITLFDSDL